MSMSILEYFDVSYIMYNIKHIDMCWPVMMMMITLYQQ